MKEKLFIVLLLLVIQIPASARSEPVLPEIDRIRIAEAFRIGETLRNEIWSNWSDAPFSLLLITDEHEFLIRHAKPSEEFKSIGYDKLLKSEIFTRPRVFQKNLLATFPAFGKPLIVVGRAENTAAKTSTPWVFTVLHEHFHQLQFSDKTYYAEVEAMNLSRGDRTGMWQINYAFPYKDEKTAEEFKNLSRLLLDAFYAKGKTERAKKLAEYLAARRLFADGLSADDYKYFSFQVWQEGVARYTEYKTAQLAARKIKPSKQFRSLKDFTAFSAEAEGVFKKTKSQLKNVDLAKKERVAFYPFGAFEGFLLDKVNPKWGENYFAKKFALEDYYTK